MILEIATLISEYVMSQWKSEDFILVVKISTGLTVQMLVWYDFDKYAMWGGGFRNIFYDGY